MTARRNAISSLMVGVLAGLGACGCTGPSSYLPVSQSAFTYPNSDVVPLGHVKGTASRTYFFQLPLDTGALKRQAVAEALKGTDGDLIIDGDFTMTSRTFGYIFTTVDQTVEGTAVRMSTVGGRPKSAATQ